MLVIITNDIGADSATIGRWVLKGQHRLRRSHGVANQFITPSFSAIRGTRRHL